MHRRQHMQAPCGIKAVYRHATTSIVMASVPNPPLAALALLAARKEHTLLPPSCPAKNSWEGNVRQSVQRQLTCGPVHVNPSHKPRRTPHGPNNESTSLPSDDEVGGAVMVAVAGAEATDEAAEAETDAEEVVMVAAVAEEAGVVGHGLKGTANPGYAAIPVFDQGPRSAGSVTARPTVGRSCCGLRGVRGGARPPRACAAGAFSAHRPLKSPDLYWGSLRIALGSGWVGQKRRFQLDLGNAVAR